MNNKLVNEKLIINYELIVNGYIFIIKNEDKLDMIDDINKYTKISGNFDNLTIEGNLVVCEFDKNCDVQVNGTINSMGNQIFE